MKVQYFLDMRYTVQKSIKVIDACAVLHNLSIELGDIMPDHIPEIEEEVEEDDPENHFEYLVNNHDLPRYVCK